MFKIVRESLSKLNFQRGLEPKDAMKTGMKFGIIKYDNGFCVEFDDERGTMWFDNYSAPIYDWRELLTYIRNDKSTIYSRSSSVDDFMIDYLDSTGVDLLNEK